MQSSLRMTLLYSVSLKINRKVLVFLILIYPSSPNGLLIGKCLLTQILTKLLKKYYFLGKRKLKIIQKEALTIFKLKEYLTKNT